MANPYRDRLFGPEQEARIQEQIDNAQVTGITSRDQIINPYDIIDTQMYRNNAAGRALMNQHLEALNHIRSQQQASYDEYYTSAEQQAMREREAGLNPNLSDNINAGDVAQTQAPDGNLLEGVPTVNDAIGSVTSIVSSLASVASLPLSFAQLSMIPAQKALLGAQAGLAGAQAGLAGTQAIATANTASGQHLSNLRSFEGLIYASAAGQFADAVAGATAAGQSFNVDEFFSNPDTFKGLYEAYVPEDTPQYKAAYKRAIGQVQKIKGEGYKLNKDTALNQTAFSEALSSPYYNDDVLLQLASLAPVMAAHEQLRLLRLDYDTKVLELSDPTLEASSRNAKYKYETDYFNGFEGDKVALYEFMTKKADALLRQCESEIYDNYFKIWKKDPKSSAGLGAAYLILSKGGHAWYEFGAANLLSNIDTEYEDVDLSSPTYKPTYDSYRTGTGQPNPVGPDGKRVLPKGFKWGD